MGSTNVSTPPRQANWSAVPQPLLAVRKLLLAAAVFGVGGPAALAEIWSGASGVDLSWGTGTNWDTGAPPPNPATAWIWFNRTGTATEAGTVTSVLDQDRTLNAGLRFSDNIDNFHTVDLGGNTLTVLGQLDVAARGPATTADRGSKYADVTITNGHLRIGTDTTSANLLISKGDPNYNGVLTINCTFTANFGTVTIVQGTHTSSGSGVLDLRGSTPTETTFRATTLNMGGGISSGPGTLYINDAGGIIDTFHVRNLHLNHGSIIMNPDTAVIIGDSEAALGVLRLGDMGQGYTSAILAPDGEFTAYVSSVQVAIGGSRSSGSVSTLDLRNATPTQSTFKTTTLVIGGGNSLWGDGGPVGHVYLNDKGGEITALELRDLTFRRGTLQLGSETNVSIGTESARGTMLVGWNGVATFAPTGDFSSFLTTLVVGQQPGSGVLRDAVGTLDLRNANITDFDVSTSVTIGSGTTRAKGLVYLGAGDVFFNSLSIGPGSSLTGNLLHLAGTLLTVGDDAADTFAITPGIGSIYFDFDAGLLETRLKVYGDQATLFEDMMLDGRFDWDSATYDPLYWMEDGYTHFGILGAPTDPFLAVWDTDPVWSEEIAVVRDAGQSYAGVYSYTGPGQNDPPDVVSIPGVGMLVPGGTTAQLWDGTASAATTVGMQWRARTAAETTMAGGGLLSDVMDLTGMAAPAGGAQGEVDPFVLAMSFTWEELEDVWGAGAQSPYLVHFDETQEEWIRAVDGNRGGTANYLGLIEYDTALHGLGDYGYSFDADENLYYAWAVLNHNSQFAVAAVPEPGAWLLLLSALACGLLWRRR